MASLNLLGDRFCTESWAKRAVHSLIVLGAQYRHGVPIKEGGTGVDAANDVSEEVVQMDGDTTAGTGQELELEQGPDHLHHARKVALASLRASLSSVLVVTQELLADKDQREV